MLKDNVRPEREGGFKRGINLDPNLQIREAPFPDMITFQLIFLKFVGKKVAEI
jgi:hypothetical protein